DSQNRSLVLYPVGNGQLEPVTASVTPPADSPVDGCTNTVTPENGAWWNCVKGSDGNRTYANLNTAGGNSCHNISWCAPGYLFTVNLSAIPGDVNPNNYALSVEVNFQCVREVKGSAWPNTASGMVGFSFFRQGANLQGGTGSIFDDEFGHARMQGYGDPFNSTFGCPYLKNPSAVYPDNFTTLQATGSFQNGLEVDPNARVG